VFLREAERQHLQTLLHQEVLRRISALQRRFRAVLERKHFLRMRRASCVIQVRAPCIRSLVELVGTRRDLGHQEEVSMLAEAKVFDRQRSVPVVRVGYDSRPSGTVFDPPSLSKTPPNPCLIKCLLNY